MTDSMYTVELIMQLGRARAVLADSENFLFIFSLYVCLYISSPLSPLTEVSPSQVATHQTFGSQLWAGEMPDSNLGLHDNSQARYH
jgi:hypothetical protein